MPLVDSKTELLHIIIDIIIDDKVYEKEIFFINFFFLLWSKFRSKKWPSPVL